MSNPIFRAVLSNPNHPEYGAVTIPFPAPKGEYDATMEMLDCMGIGNAVLRDCKVEEITGSYPVLRRLEGTQVNADELDYLAKRLDSFDVGEAAQFQAMAEKLDLHDIADFINMTFCCRQATVITDFSNLETVGRAHYMNLHDGCGRMEELEALDGCETALLLIGGGGGTVTPYGVVYDNGMKLGMCKGSESRFFNGHTNITSDRFLVFGVKGLLNSDGGVKNAMLFNVLSYLSNRLLTQGGTVATLDELHVWLSNRIAIEYIRNILKRARKRDSSMILASQNLEDFNLLSVAEMTKPLFAIPPHQFLFNAGSLDKRFYMDSLQIEESEFELIRYPQKGVCLYKCGNERYLLEVHAPGHKEKLFGNLGGR